MDKKNTKVKEAVINGQHGIFIGHWLPKEQPAQITNSDLQKLKELNGEN